MTINLGSVMGQYEEDNLCLVLDEEGFPKRDIMLLSPYR